MARRQFLFISSVIACLFAVVAGCNRKEDAQKSKATAPAEDKIVRKQTEVSVPANVKGKWKSVKISITDRESNKEGFVDIEIGKTMKVNGTNLVIKVETFLPHFVMDGTTLTSSSNSPKNPAALVHITENGQEVFKGWLFTLYPNSHASQHARYSFGLADFTPVK